MACSDSSTRPLNEQDEVTKIDIFGRPREMGHQHGEICRSEIKELLAARSEILFCESLRLSQAQLEDTCQRLWHYVNQRYPALGEEVAATAEAACVRPWELVVAGAYTDLLDVFRGCEQASYDECTVGVRMAHRCIAGTWDSHEAARKALIVLERHPVGGPATLALTTAGWPAQQGVNDSGLAFAITNLTPRHATADGLPYIAANALLAGSRTPSAFLNLMKSERFCSGHSYLFVGENGPGWIVETAEDGIDVSRLGLGEFAVKANHYRVGSPLDDNGAYANFANSCKRETAFKSGFQEIYTPADFGRAVVANHVVNRVKPEEPAVTCAYFFIDPVERSVWYQRGPAERSELKHATLRS